MSRTESECLARDNEKSSLSLYCMGTLLADEASRGGQTGFARALEDALHVLLGAMSRDDQRHALRLSYEMALGGVEPAPPRLRLVFSRD